MVFRWTLRVVITAYVGLLVGAPVGSVVFRALRHGVAPAYDAIATPAGVHAFVLTLEVALITVVLNTIFGIGAALVFARHRFRGVAVLETLVDLPLSISPVVVGLAILLCYSSTEGWLGPWLAARGIPVLFSLPGIVIACCFISLPYVVREVHPVLVELGTEQEQAAETLGAGPWLTFFRITLPSIRWGLAYGVLLTTARVLGEYGAVSVVSGNVIGHTQVLTQFVDDQLTNFDPAGAYAGALLLGLVCVVVLGALSFTRKREEQY